MNTAWYYNVADTFQISCYVVELLAQLVYNQHQHGKAEKETTVRNTLN